MLYQKTKIGYKFTMTLDISYTQWEVSNVAHRLPKLAILSPNIMGS